MPQKNVLSINIGGWIDNKLYSYNYDLGKKDWRDEDRELLQDAKFRVELTVEKFREVYSLQMNIVGEILAACDRCCDELVWSLSDSCELLIKAVAGDCAELNANESDPYIWYIPSGEKVLDLRTWVYDSLILLVTKPKFCEQVGKSCNPLILQIFKTIS